MEFTELEFENKSENYPLLQQKGIKRGVLYIFRSLDELNRSLPEQISSQYQDIYFTKHSAMFVYGTTTTSYIKSIDLNLTYTQ